MHPEPKFSAGVWAFLAWMIASSLRLGFGPKTLVIYNLISTLLSPNKRFQRPVRQQISSRARCSDAPDDRDVDLLVAGNRLGNWAVDKKALWGVGFPRFGWV